MKLPFDLGAKLILRLLVPGFLLTLGVRPLLLTVLDKSGAETLHDVGLIVAILMLGWLITLMDMPIYMLFEGRRYWPPALLSYGVHRETSRLEKWLDRKRHAYDRWRAALLPVDRRSYEEASVEVRRFPLDEETGESVALFPTRLGNLITAFEQYPKTRYGADAIFYLPRIWVKIDNDLKEDVDTQQALADSALYASLALFITGVLWLLYALAGATRLGWLDYIPAPSLSFGAGVAALVFSALLYRMAIYVNEQFGALFRALFDVYLPTLGSTLLAPDGVLQEVATLTADTSLLGASSRDKYMAVWRYLHNYRVKCPVCGGVINAAEAPQHSCRAGTDSSRKA
jgi:hypothetical protein